MKASHLWTQSAPSLQTSGWEVEVEVRGTQVPRMAAEYRNMYIIVVYPEYAGADIIGPPLVLNRSSDCRSFGNALLITGGLLSETKGLK
jgi:hypothetical protein